MCPELALFEQKRRNSRSGPAAAAASAARKRWAEDRVQGHSSCGRQEMGGFQPALAAGRHMAKKICSTSEQEGSVKIAKQDWLNLN